MTRLIAALVLGTFTLHASAFPNEPEGFRGIPWGSRLTELQEEFTLKSTSGDTKMYSRSGDRMQIGEAVLDDISYIFWNDKLTAVTIQATGINQRVALLLAFQAQFGPASQRNPYIHDYIWFGRIARIGLLCGVNNRCTAVMQSQTVLAEENAARRSAAEKAKRDF